MLFVEKLMRNNTGGVHLWLPYKRQQDSIWNVDLFIFRTVTKVFSASSIRVAVKTVPCGKNPT